MMKPVEFPQTNVIYGEGQPEYWPLPAHRTDDGIVTSCWHAGWLDRIRILFRGRVYVRTMTFRQRLQPIAVDTCFVDS